MSPSGQPSAAADPWTGRVVGGRWRILSLLDDSGGMASVYLADDTRLPRKAVVKIPKAAQLNAEFAERFAREAHHHATVENVHVVNILDRGEEAGTPYLVLQYLPGGNLKAWCAKNPSILTDPRRHFEAWLLPVAQALDAVAAKGIVHRDVKPTNILFDAAGKGYLSDFGIVKAGSEATLTGTGLFIGTLQFMSPEQCHQDGRQSLDGRSDQYGLAVTVYQVLTGWKYPVVDDTAVVYAAKFGHSPMTEPREHTPLVPEAVNDAVMRALSPDRDKRFATSVEFARAVLAGFAAGGAGLLSSPPRAAAHAAALPRSGQGLVDTVSHRAAAAGTRPAHAEVSRRAPAAAWSPARWLGAGAIVAALLAAGFLLGRSGGQRDGDGAGDTPRRPGRTATAAGDRPREPKTSAPAANPTPPPVEAAPVRPAAPRAFEVIENSIGMKLVVIPDGEFDMGSEDGDADEKPVHRVRITKAFCMGQTEVTQGQWQRVMGTTPWKGEALVKEGPNVAAPYVNWDDAVAFCRKLTEMERRAGTLLAGRVYRLPTEAEWEYACRAATKTTWSFGDDEAQMSEYAWWGGLLGDGNAKNEQYAHDVGRKRPNPWKLHDIHGNVCEWCSDWKGGYPSGPATDPTGPSAGSFRVIRGGSWSNYPVYCRSANRGSDTPAGRYSGVGFRVVCELE